ncbi:hypothetical protein F53441_10605 [Fusarium austroafricanum]|uniref:F-box domain-containing protein n=1 Tax=Fusarium austroafricanum TaxID=2364996 RepID=A0A8H4K953_9HYPO|nr:hypothetical protein F53441_10605 [Fusarium austroafricanum]
MPSDIFSKLPPELHFNIVGNLNSLHDILSFTSASPAARCYFKANQRSFLRICITEIEQHFADETIVPWVLILLKLRKTRAQTRGCTSLQIQQRIKPLLDAIVGFDYSKPTDEWKGDLGCIIALRRMFPEIKRLVTCFEKKIDCLPTRAARSEPHKISAADRRTLIDAFLRYDIYCHLFHNGYEQLFDEKAHLSEKFRPCLDRHITYPGQTNSYFHTTILELIQGRHREILNYLDFRGMVHQSKRNEHNQIEDIICLGGSSHDAVVWRRLKECRFRTRQTDDEAVYLDYISMQGYPLLQYMEQLEPKILEDYILETFFRVTTTKLQEEAGWPVTTGYSGKRHRQLIGGQWNFEGDLS